MAGPVLNSTLWRNDDSWRIAWLDRQEYRQMLTLQEALVEAMARPPAGTPDTLLLLEHDPVYTMGRTPDRSSLLATPALAYPVETVQRGGQATYHGPGQLIGYPILDLTRRVRDLHRYLRALEEVLIRTLAVYGIEAQRRAGLTGVWVGEAKIASIGVGVRRWIACHGFALNVEGGAALAPFAAITPCGLTGVRMTAMQEYTAQPLTVEGVAGTLAALLPEFLDAELPVQTS